MKTTQKVCYDDIGSFYKANCFQVFGRVSMLYVNVLVNNHPIKAFVDSGAQTTIMSPDCAEACGISYLIDERFGGIARGVGTAKILGRVHQAKIQIGDAELDCAFTVMEGKDVDLLFGLDMLRRHQACIDLLTNELRFPHTSVRFLPESEIPKKFEEAMMDEPTVEGPNGTEIGAKTGAVRPAGTSQEAASHLHGSGKQPAQSGPSSATPGASSSAPPASAARRAPAPSQSRHSEKDINTLVGLGFSQHDAIQALDATGGNVEMAAGMLFD
jgi:DNA damage-inducible protein 1